MGMPGRTDDHGGHSGTTVPRATCGDVEGLSMHQAAEITGIGPAAFKSRRHQARLRVRAAISGQALVTRRRMSRARRPSAARPERYRSGQAPRWASAYVDAETRERPRGSGVAEIATKARLSCLNARRARALGGPPSR
jgi:hypothetical protein